LILGFLSRIAAFGIAVNMLVAVLLVHARNGVFMNWSGNQKGEGYEYHLLAIAICILLMVKGAGALSVDRALTRS
jgi:putative oxidoreductase